MAPVIGPIGLDYVAASVQQAGIDVEVLDLALADEPAKAIVEHFSMRDPELVGISFRNADDCFWPSADWFVPGLKDTVETIRSMTEAPIVLGGVGYSIFPQQILKYTGADFGVCGDGETAIPALIQQLRGTRRFTDVPGLIWPEDNMIRSNAPCWPNPISLGTARSSIDNLSYFQQGGQCGLETKRGCNRKCIYCADPLAKGSKPRLRNPSEVADEAQSLLLQGIDVLHLCDAEFNVPESHAHAVCEELNRRSLGSKIRWYTYMSPSPFDADLAEAMARAGCAGIDFTGDSGSEAMLRTYRQQHGREDLAAAVKLCRLNGIAVMIDLLLGGPGETPQTVQETIDLIKKINPDCAGAALGIRIYPRTAMARMVIGRTTTGSALTRDLRDGKDGNPARQTAGGIRRKYSGPIDLLRPTFYISEALGERPAELVRDMIGGDQRFFEPAVETDLPGSGSLRRDEEAAQDNEAANYNYNENLPLTQAIRNGARGAYWDILRQLRKS
jgi:radical SAM superfamily enzyme YgiQ (UPF0313 family)